MAGTPLKIIVGLGNPGPEHLLTRHNAGFWFVDALAAKVGARFRSHTRFQEERPPQEYPRPERSHPV
jgi:PTH1 family peptidyl-tRNA hydrolase